MVVFVGFVWPEVWYEGMARGRRMSEYQVLLILHQFDTTYYQYYIIEAYVYFLKWGRHIIQPSSYSGVSPLMKIPVSLCQDRQKLRDILGDAGLTFLWQPQSIGTVGRSFGT